MDTPDSDNDDFSEWIAESLRALNNEQNAAAESAKSDPVETERNRTDGAIIFDSDFFNRATSRSAAPRTPTPQKKPDAPAVEELKTPAADALTAPVKPKEADPKPEPKPAPAAPAKTEGDAFKAAGDLHRIPRSAVQPADDLTRRIPNAEAVASEPPAQQIPIEQLRQERQPQNAVEQPQPAAEAETTEPVAAAPVQPMPENNSGKQKKPKKVRKKRSRLKKTLRWLTVLWVLEIIYYVLAISNIPVIEKWRTLYIQTAMETMSHRWLAEYFIPPTIVDPIREKMEQSIAVDVENYTPIFTDEQGESHNTNSSWDTPVEVRNPFVDPTAPKEEAFYTLFWEIEPDDMKEYVEANPSVLANDWDGIQVNESGLNDEGLPLYTKFGEQVLAIDVPNQILIVRVEGTGYRGALAIAKNPAQLRLTAASSIGQIGQYVGDICKETGAILGMTGSGFIDPDGMGNGGQIAGYALCEGERYGTHFPMGYKRVELHENNLLYITDAQAWVSDEVTDASEFQPALIVDGTMVIRPDDAWNGLNPRACLGQSNNGEILMLCIEGRSILDGVFGTGVYECATILSRHRAYQAMNLDGGSSAMMWYDGKYIIHCSNGNEAGRPMPTAWTYGGYSE